MLIGFPQTSASFYYVHTVILSSNYLPFTACVHSFSTDSCKLEADYITSITLYSVCADSLHSLPPPLSLLSSSSVVLVVGVIGALLAVGVGVAILEVGVGVIGALP